MLGLTEVQLVHPAGPPDQVVVERLVSGEHPRPACTKEELHEAIRVLAPRCTHVRHVVRRLMALPDGESLPNDKTQRLVDERVARAVRWLGVDVARPAVGMGAQQILNRNVGKGSTRAWSQQNDLYAKSDIVMGRLPS